MSADIVRLIDRMEEPKRTETINRTNNKFGVPAPEDAPNLYLVDDTVIYMSAPYSAPPSDCG